MMKVILKARRLALTPFFFAALASGIYALEDLPLVNTQTLSLEMVDTVSIGYGSGEVIIRESDSGDLVIREYMNRDWSRYYARITSSAGTVRVRGRRPLFSFRWKSRMEIYLPASFHENLQIESASGTVRAETDILNYRAIDVSINSGTVFLNRLQAESVSVSISSGRLDIKDISGRSFIRVSSGILQIGGLAGGEHRIRTSSGRIKIALLRGGAHIEMNSGNIAVEKTLGRIEAGLSSGGLSLGDFSGEGSFELSSGDISLDMRELTGDMRFSVSSGNINMNIPGLIPFNLDAVTRSGAILINEGGDNFVKVSGNSTTLRPFEAFPKSADIQENALPARTIYARTNSGNIAVNRL